MAGIDQISSAVGAGLGLIGGIGGMFAARRNNRELDKLVKQNPTYAANPIAQQRLGLATSLLNARMPGAAQMDRNILGAQANASAGIMRGATDSSQLLQQLANSQGQTDQSFENMQLQEQQDFQRRYGNLVGAQEGVINEGDKVYQDQVRRFGDLAQIRGAQAQNRSNAWSSLSNMGGGIMSFGMQGGFNGMFGGGGGGGSQGAAAAFGRLKPSTSMQIAPIQYGGINTGNIPLPH